MKIFIDSAEIGEIKEAQSYGILDGVTTNPSLIKKALEEKKGKGKNVNIEYHIAKIFKAVGKKAPVSLEVVGSDFKEMVKEGRILHKKFKKCGNIYVKIPVDPCMDSICTRDADGIKAIKTLSRDRIKINCTLIFTPEQALLAAKAGAKIVSPFIGREDDYIRETNRIKFKKEDYFPALGRKKFGKILNDSGIVSGVDLVRECRRVFDLGKIKAEILAASIRNKRQFREVVLAGADIATLPFEVIKTLLKHHKSVEGMKKFTKDVVDEYARLVAYKSVRSGK